VVGWKEVEKLKFGVRRALGPWFEKPIPLHSTLSQVSNRLILLYILYLDSTHTQLLTFTALDLLILIIY
jgi:hypothetical protein